MKKYLSFILVVILVFSFSACQSRESLKEEIRKEVISELEEESSGDSTPSNDDNKSGGSREEKSTEESGVFNVEEYKKIFVKSHNAIMINLIYSSTFSDEVTLKGRQEIVDSAKVHLSGDTLTIDIDDPRNNKFFTVVGSNETIDVYIGAATLEEIILEGGMEFRNNDIITAENLKISVAGVLEMEGEIHADNVKIFVAGASEMDINFVSKSITLDSSGASEGVFSGSTQSLVVNSKGATEINSLDLEADDVTLKGAGVIEAKVRAAKTLGVSVAGISEIEYRGDAVVTNSTPFLSEVVKID